jgi:hypothetical protein
MGAADFFGKWNQRVPFVFEAMHFIPLVRKRATRDRLQGRPRQRMKSSKGCRIVPKQIRWNISSVGDHKEETSPAY